MSPDVDVQTRRDIRQRVQLRQDRFDLVTTILGCRTEVSRADLIGVTPRTLRRVRQGVIGEEFMAKAVSALKPRANELAPYGIEVTGLDDLFLVAEEAA